MQRLADRELHILFTTVTERLAPYDEDTEEGTSNNEVVQRDVTVSSI
jgi:hypothetical protein